MLQNTSICGYTLVGLLQDTTAFGLLFTTLHAPVFLQYFLLCKLLEKYVLHLTRVFLILFFTLAWRLTMQDSSFTVILLRCFVLNRQVFQNLIADRVHLY